MRLISSHPVSDSFVLVIKASLLASRGAKWLRKWHQREARLGDDMEGPSWPSYQALIQDIQNFQYVDIKRSMLTADDRFLLCYPPSLQWALHPTLISSLIVLYVWVSTSPDRPTYEKLVHILPCLTWSLLQEPFASWENAQDAYATNIHQSCQTVMEIWHSIPSNLDLCLFMTPLVALLVQSLMA